MISRPGIWCQYSVCMPFYHTYTHSCKYHHNQETELSLNYSELPLATLSLPHPLPSSPPSRTPGNRLQCPSVSWQRYTNGHEGLACCSSWSCKESDTTERLNWYTGDEFSQLGLSENMFILLIFEGCFPRIWNFEFSHSSDLKIPFYSLLALVSSGKSAVISAVVRLCVMGLFSLWPF